MSIFGRKKGPAAQPAPKGKAPRPVDRKREELMKRAGITERAGMLYLGDRLIGAKTELRAHAKRILARATPKK